MANISSYLERIKEAIYGEEVRGSIYDALVAMNAEATSAMEFAATAKDSAQASAASASSSASTATQKANEALASAGEAKNSEQNAASSESVAKQKASAAAASEAAAKTSEQNAANSESVAIQKAADAAASESAAAQSAAIAGEAEAKAEDVLAEAKSYSSQITTDKNAAEAAKSAAESARDVASASETAAKKSETAALTAQRAAEEAKDAASASNAAAQSAKSSAESARDDAQASESAAGQSASDAAQSASTAQQYSGNPPKPQDGTWWIWNAATGEYVDSHIRCELEGPQGTSIDDISITSGTHGPGTSDIYTITMSDGATYTFSVYNGRNGEGAGDVLGKSFDIVLPAAEWSNRQITIADERFIANSTYKYFVSADEASCEEFLNHKVQAKDITTTGSIIFTNETDPTNDLTVSVIRFELSANG